MSALYSGLTGFLPITKCSAPRLPKTIGAPYDEVKAKPGIVSVCLMTAATAAAGGLDCGESTRTPAPTPVFTPQVDLFGLVIATDPDAQLRTTQPACVRAASIEAAKPSASGSGANTLTSNLVPGKALAARVTALASMDRGAVSSASRSSILIRARRSCSAVLLASAALALASATATSSAAVRSRDFCNSSSAALIRLPAASWVWLVTAEPIHDDKPLATAAKMPVTTANTRSLELTEFQKSREYPNQNGPFPILFGIFVVALVGAGTTTIRANRRVQQSRRNLILAVDRFDRFNAASTTSAHTQKSAPGPGRREGGAV